MDTGAVPVRCIYTIDLNAYRSVTSTLLFRFSGSLDDPSVEGNTISSDHLLALYLASSSLESTSAFFANISASLTTYVRQYAYAGLSPPATGTVSVGTTCVRVQWGWVGYAGATTLLLLVFFVAMVVHTRRAQVAPYHDFKSSALTLLYHGLEGESLDEAISIGQRNSEWQLDEMAKGMAVQLVHTDMGWKMRTVRVEGKTKDPDCYGNY